MNYNDFIKQLKEKQYAPVPFPLGRLYFNQAAHAFFSFLELPQEIKNQFKTMVDESHRGSFVGYMRRTNETGYDNKEYFHYHPIVNRDFRTLRGELKDKRVEDFFRFGEEIYTEASKTFNSVLHELEKDFPNIHQQFFIEPLKRRFILRFLKYDAGRPGDFLAMGHYDQGSCTLALSESAPGLRIGKDEKSLEHVVHQEGSALFMPGISFPFITDETFVPAWHDVVQKGEETYSDEAARWAIVFFADALGAPVPTREEAHTPKQY